MDDEIWSQIKALLKKRVGKQDYEIWIDPIQVSQKDDNNIYLSVPNRYYREYIQPNYGVMIQTELRKKYGRAIGVHFEIANEDSSSKTPASSDASPHSIKEPTRPTILDTKTTEIPLNTQHSNQNQMAFSADKTFDNFVVGGCNQFAYAASHAVAESPGDPQYNPLFIYGPTGLGKTHLVHAIGNKLLQLNPSAHVVYVTGEQFTNNLIDALRFRDMREFRERYRNSPTVLLMDDVQFISGKDRTQEELFHTFEWLKERGRQIVFTADVLPREILGFEPRLRSRCESGMIADTHPPDMETMLAILRQKAEDMNLDMPDDLGQFIATRIARGNIRELEGALNRLKMMCGLLKESPTIDFARAHLGDMFTEQHVLTPDDVIQTVADFFNIKVIDLKGKRRLKQFVRPRHISMYLMRKHTEHSFPEIGRIFNGRDHATVQHACKKIQGLIDQDADLGHPIAHIERLLGIG